MMGLPGKEKCKSCRTSKQKCRPENRVWDVNGEQQKCDNCVRGGRQCGPNVRPNEEHRQRSSSAPGDGRPPGLSEGGGSQVDDIIRSTAENGEKAEKKRILKEKINLLDQYQEIFEQSRLTLQPLSTQNSQLPQGHPYDNLEESLTLDQLQASTKDFLLVTLAEVKVLAAQVAVDGDSDAAEVAYGRALQTCRLAPLHGSQLRIELLKEVGSFYSKIGENLQAEKQWRELLQLQLPDELRDNVLQQLGRSVVVSSVDITRIFRSTRIGRDLVAINVPFPPQHRLLRCVPGTITDVVPLRKFSLDRDIIGYPPIHSAIISKNIHVFEMIQFCSDVELLSKDIYQRSPLFLAALCKGEGVGERIMDRFTDRDAGIRGRLMNDRDTLGNTVLTISILSDCSFDFILALLNNGAEPDPIPLEDASPTPLKAAAMRGRADIIGMLLSRGARDHRSPFGSPTALMHAQMRGHTAIVEQLTSVGQHHPI